MTSNHDPMGRDGDKVQSVTTPALNDSSAHRAWGLETSSLGLALGGAHEVGHVERQRKWVDLAESLEMHSVWLPEMHFAPGVCPAPLIELAGFAARTKKLRLGTTSLLLPLHPPEEIAAEIAALDRISGGRLLIGLGRGFQKKMLEAFGVNPSTKRDRFDESLDRILSLWAEANETNGPLGTHQKPHPPLAVAAFGPKGLAQAASRGLPYLASPVETFDQIADNQSIHRALLPESSAAPLSLVMRTVFVSDSDAELRAAKASLGEELNRRRPGMPAAVNQALESPLDARVVVGKPDVVRERLRADREKLGIDLLIVRPAVATLEAEACEASLRILVREIWPEVVGQTG
jgi:alkanesulfonate monooxygenase SsuD/methylene tetrahydromethanopterin reductase-like flavin-dependent oxidoreductase (luciferase family)